MTTPHQPQPHTDGIPDELRVELAMDYVKQNFESGEPWSMTIARAILNERGRFYAVLGRLDGDSLDAMMEVVGEGPEFKRYNQGKSAMRNWFLRRINAILPNPPSTTQSQTGRQSDV